MILIQEVLDTLQIDLSVASDPRTFTSIAWLVVRVSLIQPSKPAEVATSRDV
jgi:hypothetical protein